MKSTKVELVIGNPNHLMKVSRVGYNVSGTDGPTQNMTLGISDPC